MISLGLSIDADVIDAAPAAASAEETPALVTESSMEEVD